MAYTDEDINFLNYIGQNSSNFFPLNSFPLPYPSNDSGFIANDHGIRPELLVNDSNEMGFNNVDNVVFVPTPQQSYQHSSPTIKASDPSPSKIKRARTAFTSSQIFQLEQQFLTTKYLDCVTRLQMAKNMQLTERQIKVWFQNRRMKYKKQWGKNMLPSSHGLSSSITVANQGSDIDSCVKSQVISPEGYNYNNFISDNQYY